MTWCVRCQKYTESYEAISETELFKSVHYYCAECKTFKESTFEIPNTEVK